MELHISSDAHHQTKGQRSKGNKKKKKNEGGQHLYQPIQTPYQRHGLRHSVVVVFSSDGGDSLWALSKPYLSPLLLLLIAMVVMVIAKKKKKKAMRAWRCHPTAQSQLLPPSPNKKQDCKERKKPQENPRLEFPWLKQTTTKPSLSLSLSLSRSLSQKILERRRRRRRILLYEFLGIVLVSGWCVVAAAAAATIPRATTSCQSSSNN